VRDTAGGLSGPGLTEGAPLKTPICGRVGNRREPYDLHPDALASPAARPVAACAARASGRYAVWSYAHHAARWKQVAEAVSAVKAAFIRSFGQPFFFDPAEPGPHEPKRVSHDTAPRLFSSPSFGKLSLLRPGPLPARHRPGNSVSCELTS
jgi:hypothetical protein